MLASLTPSFCAFVAFSSVRISVTSTSLARSGVGRWQLVSQDVVLLKTIHNPSIIHHNPPFFIHFLSFDHSSLPPLHGSPTPWVAARPPSLALATSARAPHARAPHVWAPRLMIREHSTSVHFGLHKELSELCHLDQRSGRASESKLRERTVTGVENGEFCGSPLIRE